MPAAKELPISPQAAPLVSIADLPNEVVTQVFSAGTDNWRDSRPLGLPFPVLVSATCYHWRLLAQSNPHLWTFIVPPLHKDDPDCLQWTSKWLAKSATLPVSVVLDDKLGRSRRSSEATTKLVSEALALIIQSVDRLQRLDISVYTFKALENTTRSLLNAPHLQQISLCFREPYFISSFSTAMHSKWNWLVNLPSLTKLRIQSVILPNPRNLTSLTATKLLLGYEDTLNLFSASPHLTNLVLHELLPVKSLITNQRAPIQVNSLQHLAIHSHGIEERGAIYFFSFLVIPNLRYLEVDGNTRVASILGTSIVSAKITKLRISNCSKFFFVSHPTESERDINFYHSLSTIRHLELVHVPTNRLLPRFNPKQDGQGGASAPKTSTSGPSHTSSNITWPELCTIMLDTVLPGDVLRLADFIKSHKNVKSVELSNSAAHQLSENLRRKVAGDTIFQITPQLISAGTDKDNKSKKDVFEWLSGLVEVKTLQSYKYGLLDGDRASLWKML